MNEVSVERPPVWFWIAAALALVWNLMGVATYLMEVYADSSMVAELTEAERQLKASMPAWVMGAYAIAVFAGALGCLGLLLRKRWAKILLIISLVAVLAQQTWVFILSDVIAMLGTGAVVIPIIVIVVAVGLVWFAHYSERRGWLS